MSILSQIGLQLTENKVMKIIRSYIIFSLIFGMVLAFAFTPKTGAAQAPPGHEDPTNTDLSTADPEGTDLPATSKPDQPTEGEAPADDSPAVSSIQGSLVADVCSKMLCPTPERDEALAQSESQTVTWFIQNEVHAAAEKYFKNFDAETLLNEGQFIKYLDEKLKDHPEYSQGGDQSIKHDLAIYFKEMFAAFATERENYTSRVSETNLPEEAANEIVARIHARPDIQTIITGLDKKLKAMWKKMSPAPNCAIETQGKTTPVPQTREESPLGSGSSVAEVDRALIDSVIQVKSGDNRTLQPKKVPELTRDYTEVSISELDNEMMQIDTEISKLRATLPPSVKRSPEEKKKLADLIKVKQSGEVLKAKALFYKSSWARNFDVAFTKTIDDPKILADILHPPKSQKTFAQSQRAVVDLENRISEAESNQDDTSLLNKQLIKQRQASSDLRKNENYRQRLILFLNGLQKDDKTKTYRGPLFK